MTAPRGSPTRRAGSSVKQALADRLLLSEAIDAVRKLIRGYPNGGANAGDGYLGALASVLCQYPRQVALRCADPLRGVARETKFLPTVADLVAWCERESEPLRRQADREDRVVAQLEAREAWQNIEKDPVLLAKTQAWLDRTDPVAAELVAKTQAEEEARREAATQFSVEAHRKQFRRECEQAGIDPAGLASPALLKTLGARHVG